MSQQPGPGDQAFNTQTHRDSQHPDNSKLIHTHVSFNSQLLGPISMTQIEQEGKGQASKIPQVQSALWVSFARP